MSVCLLGSSLVTATLIEPRELIPPSGRARRRQAVPTSPRPPTGPWPTWRTAKARTCINPLFGEVFGTIYDISTVVILWFAGASAMAGLLNLVPQYLPRYGMAPEWARAVRPLVVLFTVVNLFVTWVFNADVSAQGGAYATGVLVLISSACVATVIDQCRIRSGHWLFRMPWAYCADHGRVPLHDRGQHDREPDGLKIASCFILAVVLTSAASRLKRSTELRFGGFEFVDDQSRFLWDSSSTWSFPCWCRTGPAAAAWPRRSEASASGTG